MTIDLFVENSPLDKSGSRYELSAYSVTEESTPINGGDSSGGTGQVSFTALESPEVETLFGRKIEVTDRSNGRITGTVNSLNNQAGLVNIVADSWLGKLNAVRQVQPFRGTLGGAIRYYMGLADITAQQIVVDSALESRNVLYHAWYGSVWDNLKQLCIAEQIEISEVSGLIQVRPLRGRELSRVTDSLLSWSVANNQLARKVEVYNYNTRYETRGLIYPPGGWNSEVQVYQVDAGQLLEVPLQLDASVISVVQPVAVDVVPPSYTGPDSVYTITGSDNKAITAAQWKAQGGKVTIEVQEDRSTLMLKIQGASDAKMGPYRLSMTSGDGTVYSSLRIVGEALIWNKELITVHTGVPDHLTGVEVGVTIDSPYISNAAKAYTVALSASQRFAGSNTTISVTANVVNRDGEIGAIGQMTFKEFNTLYADTTFEQFNTIWADKTYGDFTQFVNDRSAGDFENQAFGNVVGSRVNERHAFYRIRSATITPEAITYQGEMDTLFGDFNAVWANKTFADFNSAWANYTYRDFAARPLRT